MKIVCDACQAKYSISDDKVQGKVFKIRCKKCSNIIVVRGGANAAEAAPPPQQETNTYDYGYDANQSPQGDEAVWHVVINQDQVGPMTVAEVGQRFSAGEIDAESYIWREGFSDWLPLAQVEQFAALAGGRAGNGRADMFPGAGTGSEDAGTARSDPGDLFAAASASSHASGGGGGGMGMGGMSGGGGGEDDGGGDLFGSQQAAAAQQQGGAAKLRGERNENSVLFSLNNLAQLASDKPAAPSAAMTSTPSGHATGAAGGEGSGLIDIRSMASAYLGSQGASPGKATTSSIGTIDDLPVFGGGGFSEPAVIVPTARAANNNKILYVMIGAVGLLAIAAVVMVVALLKGGGGGDKTDKDKQVAAAGNAEKSGDTTPTANGGGAGGGGSGGNDSGGTATPPSTTPGGSGGTAATTPATTPSGGGSGGGSTGTLVASNTPPPTSPTTHPATAPTPHPTPHPATTPAVTHTPTTTSTPTPAAPPPDKKPPAGGDSSGCDEVSCLLGTASGPCCAKFKKSSGGNTTAPPSGGNTTAAPSGGNSSLPETLDRDMISGGVGAISGAARACGSKAAGVKGKVKVHVKVAPGGNITGVDVSETPDAGLGNCVAAAMGRAHFAKTQKGGSFSYPFVF